MTDAERKRLQVDVPQALEMAVQFHRQGWLEPAEEVYRAVLKLLPGEPNALHYLGVLLHQTGNSAAAVMPISIRSIVFMGPSRSVIAWAIAVRK